MKTDIKQVENLSFLFMQMLSDIFIRPCSNPALDEITAAQRKILYILSVNGPQKMSDLAQHVYVSMAATTGVVDKLVAAKFVIRESDPADRRVVRVALTSLGEKTQRDLNGLHESRLREILEVLPEEKRRELIACFEQIYRLLCEIRDAARSKNATAV